MLFRSQPPHWFLCRCHNKAFVDPLNPFLVQVISLEVRRQTVHIELKMWILLCLSGVFVLVFMPFLIRYKLCSASWLLENTELLFFKGFSVATLRCHYWPGEIRAQHLICGFRCNPQILLYIYLHWELLAIAQAFTKLFVQFFTVCPYPCHF